MKAVAPEQRIGQQEVNDLVPPVVEDQRAPVLVLPLARVGVLVKRGAVESGQRPVIAREVRRHPVNNHTDAGFVESVDQILEILGRAVAARRRVEAHHLVAPRRVKGVLGNRHEFHVREAHLLDVLDQRLGQRAIPRRFPRRLLPPGTEVDFVNAQRRPQRITLPPLRQPGLVRPLELAVAPHDGRVLRRLLEEEAVRIGLHADLAVRHQAPRICNASLRPRRE